MSKIWNCRPSSLLRVQREDVDDHYLNWCIDEAVFVFGSWVDSRMDGIQDSFMDGESRQRKELLKRTMQAELNKILSYGSEVEIKEDDLIGLYRDPAALVKNKRIS